MEGGASGEARATGGSRHHQGKDSRRFIRRYFTPPKYLQKLWTHLWLNDKGHGVVCMSPGELRGLQTSWSQYTNRCGNTPRRYHNFRKDTWL